ncbi:MAG: group 1 glycosyl transferase [Candidatus Berkelbacteria bacterium Licking1014_7]|uniref:Group 1 glycosyl transferase n=1 Tax=Candidatus Berkelbacteria bacterium Licking1014_7 TaxID=2017147 RepID=A0A554LKN6_9BACT|nr:MAG: group 1 glycosyl transferase [Candidatus Berkelbacteria bacterium Licking1014_7]
MKILFVTEVYHPTINGVVISIDTFKKELEKRGHQVYILAPENPRSNQDEKNVFRTPSLPLNKDLDYFLALPNQITFETVKMIAPDIIHTHHIWTLAEFALRCARELNIPLVATYHTLMEEYSHKVPVLSKFSPTKNAIKSFIRHKSRKFCNQLDAVISPSLAMKKIMRRYGITQPIEVISTGIKLSDFKFHNKNYILKKHKISAPGARLLLFVGRLAYEKNVSMLIESFRRINQQISHTYLIILGSGPQENTYQNLVKKLNLAKNVIMPGFVDPDETKKYFGTCDLFCFPSITDTQGIVILEAMAGGAVPVAVNKLGPTDIINSGYNGFLVANNQQKFTEAIIKLLQNPKLLQKFRKNGLAKARHFTSVKQTDKLIDLYQKIQNARAK